MNTATLHEQAWPYVVTLLPADFAETARNSGALVRCRHVPDAAALMRLALAYAVSDLSLKDVAAWAHAMEVAEITGPGLFYRLREAEGWLQQVLAGTLQAEVAPTPVGIAARVRVVDATVITGPASQGTNWRVHVEVEPTTGTLSAVEVTDARSGEGYGRFTMAAGEIIVGDRCYARARGIADVHQAGAHVVVRVTPQAIRLCDRERGILHLPGMAEAVPQVGAQEWEILVPVPPDEAPKGKGAWPMSKAKDWIPARIVASKTQKGEVIWLLTTLGQEVLPAMQVLRLYRLRWQVELAFKRLKSLLHVDTLPTRQGPTAKSWLLARLLAAALAQRLAQPAGPLSPWGYELLPARVHA